MSKIHLFTAHHLLAILCLAAAAAVTRQAASHPREPGQPDDAAALRRQRPADAPAGEYVQLAGQGDRPTSRPATITLHASLTDKFDQYLQLFRQNLDLINLLGVGIPADHEPDQRLGGRSPGLDQQLRMPTTAAWPDSWRPGRQETRSNASIAAADCRNTRTR